MRPCNNPLNFGTYAVPVYKFVANASFNSIAQWATDILRCSAQFVVTGTVAGTVQMQVSNDKAVGLPPNQFQPTNWNNIGSPVTLTNAGSYLVPYIETSYQYIRFVYTDTSSGSATGSVASANFESKGL